MPIYKVSLSAENFSMLLEDDDALCGFIKNEYVLADDINQAVDKAKDKVTKKLKKKEAIIKKDFIGSELKVEETEKVGIFKIFSNEGFIFYRMDKQ